jgi:ankyrin repeat protein
LILACLLLVAQRTVIWHWYLSPAVYYAVGNDDANKTLTLLKKGANPTYVGAGGLAGGTPLIWAASQGHVATMRVLIANGADVNRRTSGGVSALDCATINGKTVAVELLLNSGASR